MSPKHTTSAFHTAKPIRIRIPKLLDILLVTDPEQIVWLNQHPNLTRPIDPSRSWLHRILDGRLRGDLSLDGQPLPVFESRDDPRRAQRQKELFAAFEGLRGLPGAERDVIVDYISGHAQLPEIGVVVQQWCGRLFSERYRSTEETYTAGRLFASWPSSPPWRTLRDRLSGRLARAKAVLGTAAENDVHCVHGTSVGMENIARSVRKLRKAAHQADTRTLSADEIVRECLSVPPALVRGCSGVVAAPFLDRPLSDRTLVVFLLGRAFAETGDLDVAFLSDTWSACPARVVIPEMLRAVWRAAQHDEAEAKRLLSIDTWSRLWHRAVS